MLKVAFILESDESVAGHYRVEACLDAFEREGLDVYPMLLPVGLREHRRMARDLAAFDAVVLQRVLPGRLALALLRGAARVMGYDFDDITALTGDSPGEPGIMKRVKFETVTRKVDFVTAASEHLAALAGVTGGNVFAVPTPVDTARYAPREKHPGPPCIGWIGSKGTLEALEDILPAIERVAAARPGVTLCAISDAEPPRRPFIRHVRPEQEIDSAEIAALDVAVAPFPDTRWGGGQSGLGLSLAGACGVPVIASPVGAAQEMVVDGETGLFATDAAGWEASLLALIDDPDRRRAMGEAARARALERYSTEVVIPRWAGIIKKMVSRSA